MSLLKYEIITFFVVGLLLSCVNDANAISRWVPLDEKVEESDLIIIGAIDFEPHMMYKIKIKEVLLGKEELKGKEIFISKKMIIIEEDIFLIEGETVVLFLKKEDKTTISDTSAVEEIFDSEGNHYQLSTIGAQSIEYLTEKGKPIKKKEEILKNVRFLCRQKKSRIQDK